MCLFLKNFWKTIVWAALIIILSCLPEDNIPSPKWDILPYQDKILHLIFYCVLSLFFIKAYQLQYKKPLLNPGVILISLAFIFVFGMILEIVQEIFIRSRNGEIMDLVFNIIGLIIALVLLYLLNYFKKYSHNPKG